jgi:hypothetical protein
MTVPCYDGQALALFGHEQDAGLFLRSLENEDPDAGWRSRETRCGEVASVLCGPCANAERVVLDPLPASVADGTAALASVDRVNFVASLLALDGAAGGSRPCRTPRGRRVSRRRRSAWGTGPEGRAREKLG